MARIARKLFGGALAAATLMYALAAALPRAAHSAQDSPQPRAHRGPRATSIPTPSAIPADVRAKVPVYKPGPLPLHDGEQLVFAASWIGIPAAQARIEFHKVNPAAAGDPRPTSAARKSSPADVLPPAAPGQWRAEAWVETNKVVDVLYKMRDYVRENLAPDTLHSQGVYVIQHENQRFNVYTVSFDRAHDRATATKTNLKGKLSREFVATDPWGPLSGAMMALTLPLAAGKTYAFDVFAGGQRYVFAFEVSRREKITTALGEFDAWRIVPDVWYVSDGSIRSEARGTVLWVSADDRHLPLRIQSQVFIGYVRADLIRIDGKGVATPE